MTVLLGERPVVERLSGTTIQAGFTPARDNAPPLSGR